MRPNKQALLIIIVLVAGSVSAQTILERYKKAELFLPKNVSKLTRNVSVRVNQVDETSSFWYKLQTETGEKYYFFDGEKIKSKEAFDPIQLAEAIEQETGKNVSSDSLKLADLKFKLKGNSIQFKIDTIFYEVRLDDYSIEKINKKKKYKKNQSVSPDEKWIAEVRDFNLFLKDVITGEEFQLTLDGIEKHEYATPLSWYKMVDESVGAEYDPTIYVSWSNDS
ncbi:MAG: hypothetical protein GQ525_15620, partial [Draconibacterium sp.]|nr:hypothetical protein [Draconibacterium sp.]